MQGVEVWRDYLFRAAGPAYGLLGGQDGGRGLAGAQGSAGDHGVPGEEQGRDGR